MRPTGPWRPGFFMLVLATVGLPTGPLSRAQAADFAYGQALQMSLYFFEAQQSGALSPHNRVPWRGPSHLDDGRDAGRDLSGGWYHGGDHWKSNYTMAFAASMVAWSAVRYPDAYLETGQMRPLLESLQHVNEYFLKCIVDPHPHDLNRFDGFELYIDVGGKPGPAPGVHSVWCAPEVTAQFTARQSLKVNTTVPGPDVAAAMAAAMAASAIVFDEHGDESTRPFAATLLRRARKLYAYARGHPFRYRKGPDGGAQAEVQALDPAGRTRRVGYRGDETFDDLLFAAAWLHRADRQLKADTDAFYLDQARQILAEAGRDKPLEQRFGPTQDHGVGHYHHAALMLLLEIHGPGKDTASWETLLREHLKHWDALTPSKHGLKIRDAYDDAPSLKWTLPQAALAALYADWTNDPRQRERFASFARSQIDYALGDNRQRLSFMVGFGQRGWPKTPHHRGAHGAWGGFESLTSGRPEYQPRARHTLYGAVLGGPDAQDRFNADFNPQQNEPTLDLNAAAQLVLASIVAQKPSAYPTLPADHFPPPIKRDLNLDWRRTDREFFVVARRADRSEKSIRIEAEIHNHSRWPPRVCRQLSFRYFFRLEPGADIRRIEARLIGSQGGRLSPPKLWKDDVHYVEAHFAGQEILPTRIYKASQRPGKRGSPDDLYRRKITFELAATGDTPWRSDNDDSAHGLDGTMKIRPRMAVYDGGRWVGGEEPER